MNDYRVILGVVHKIKGKSNMRAPSIPSEYQDYVVGADLPGYLLGPHYKVVTNNRQYPNTLSEDKNE